MKTLILSLLAAALAAPLCAQDASPLTIPATDDGLPGAGPIRRYDWFQKLWLQKREAWAKEVEAKQGALVFLGDSITQGWGDDLNGAFGKAKVANRGISGDTTRGMLIRLQQDVLALKPSGVVMLMGTNDLEEGATPEVIAGNLKLIIDALHAADKDMPIVLCNVFPSHASKKRPADQIKQINKLYAEAVKGNRQVTQINTWAMFANAEGDARVGEFPDLLHPNKAGYRMWADTLRPVLETLDLVQVPADDFEPEPGFRALFNGKDLTGWGYRAKKTLAKTESFDGKKTSSEGRYLAKHGRLIVSTPPEGRASTQLWTHEEFGSDFVLKLQFRANADADSGIFLRKPQLQCRDYLVAGPYKELKKYKAGDWNEIIVTAKGGAARCTCNGEVLEAEFKLPPSGPIGLEGDRGQMEYRRIRIKTKDYEVLKNLPYREGGDAYQQERCKLDLYRPVGREGFATVVWFHGGGLRNGKKSVPEQLKGQGIAVVPANYRLHPKVKCPAYIEDAAAAVAWTFKNIARYGGDPDRIFVSGHSAGGYLTSMVGLDKSYLAAHDIDADRIAGLIPFSGHTITHFTPRKERGIKGEQAIIDRFAPLFHVRPDAPPLVLITGDRELEMLGRYEENAYLWRMMKVAKHNGTKLYELDGFDHGGMAVPAFGLLLEQMNSVREAKDGGR